MKLRTEFQKEYYPQVIEIYQRTDYSCTGKAQKAAWPLSFNLFSTAPPRRR